MTATREQMLEIAWRAALAAGDAILGVYSRAFDVQQKTDKTPVTEADLASERIIVAMLSEAFPDIPVVSEELVEAEGLPPWAARFWAVDPLDGTREFIAKNGEFAVSIGLVENGIPILGIVHGPAVGVTYAACGPGTAARRRRGSQPEPIRARTPSADGLVVIHSRSHENSRRLAEFLASYPVRERKKCGSALKFGVIAAGEADLYPRFGTTMEWDTAAGQAILEAAGGRVETLAGAPLAYGKPGLKNDGFLAWGALRRLGGGATCTTFLQRAPPRVSGLSEGVCIRNELLS
jgi:3'(2'), 5'-bisphosphate nucleotidase